MIIQVNSMDNKSFSWFRSTYTIRDNCIVIEGEKDGDRVKGVYPFMNVLEIIIKED